MHYSCQSNTTVTDTENEAWANFLVVARYTLPQVPAQNKAALNSNEQTFKKQQKSEYQIYLHRCELTMLTVNNINLSTSAVTMVNGQLKSTTNYATQDG
jgi:hypothetical protein